MNQSTIMKAIVLIVRERKYILGFSEDPLKFMKEYIEARAHMNWTLNGDKYITPEPSVKVLYYTSIPKDREVWIKLEGDASVYFS